MSSPFAGAEMMTFFAPASMCFEAFSRSEKTLSSLPSMLMPVSVASTSPGKRPRMESYFRRCASVVLSVMSLTPTQSMSAPLAWAARKTFLPMRPKPLMPTLTAIYVLSSSGGASPGAVAVPPSGARESISGVPASGAAGWLVHVPVDHVNQVVPAVLVDPREVLCDHHRAVAAAGAADPHGQVGLALLLVGVEQVVEERLQPVVELGDPLRGLDVVAHFGVAAGLVAEVL